MHAKKLRLLIVSQDSSAYGGAEVLLNSMAKNFVKDGVEVFSISNFGPFNKMQREVGVSDIFVPFRLDVIGGVRGFVKFFIQAPYGFYWYYQWCRKVNPGVLLLCGFSEKIIVSPVAKLLSIPVVWLEHAPLETVIRRNFSFPKFLYKAVVPIPKIIITPSKNTKIHICHEIGIAEGKVKVIHNGIVIRNFKRPVLRLAVNSLNACLLMISRLQKEKGQDTAIKALSILRNKGIKARLVLVGEGDFIQKLSLLASQLGVEKQVEFTGFVSEQQKYSLIKQAQIYLFPTRWKMEGFGIAPLEAMSCGVPVVASNVGPVPEVVGNAGLLVDPSPEMVASAVEKLLKDKKLYTRLSRNGPTRVKKYFDIEKTSRSYLRVFYSL